MERTLVSKTPGKIGQTVTLSGWVEKRRDHGQLIFFDLRDRSGIVQVVGGSELSDLRSQDVVGVVGKVRERPEGSRNKELPTGSVEVAAENVEVLSKADTLPFDMGGPDLNLELPTLLDWRPLTLRHQKVTPIFEVQEAIVEGFRKTARELGCTEIFVPTIVASSTEGGAEVFSVQYYDHTAYLAQSPQLYKQMMVPVYEKVYTIGHAYRAEPSTTTYHLSEVVQLDIEMGFVEFNDLLDSLEKVGTSMVEYAEGQHSQILENFGIGMSKIPDNVPRLKLREAQEIVKNRTGRDVTGEDDLSREDEKEIWQWALKEHNSDFVTVTHFPIKKRAFYTMPDPEDPQYSLSYDLIFKGLEIASGSQRINSYKELVGVIKDRGMDPKDFEMYLQSFKFGMPPEGGFSFGLERVTMQILGLSNIRQASLFPRDMERVDTRLSQKSHPKGLSHVKGQK